MRSKRLGSIVAVLGLVLGVVVTTGVAFAAGNTNTDFSKLKHINPPKDCSDVPGVSNNEIKVGVLIPSSGPTAQSFQAGLDGMKARIAKANAENELGKRKITLEFGDDAGDPAKNLTEAQDLVENKGVFGLIENSPFAFSSAKYLNQQGVPVVGWHLGLKEFGIYPNFFGWRNSQPSDPSKHFTTRNVDVLKKLGATKVALLSTNIANSSTFIKQIAQAIKLSHSGMKVVYQTTDVPPEQRDFTAEVQKIKDSGADAMYTGMDFLQNTGITDALNQAGVKLKAVVFPGGYDSRTLGLPGIDGVYFGIETVPFEENPPAYLEYKKWMTQDDPNKFYAGQIPYYGWLSADAFIEGLKAAGKSCPTREAFINNLRLEKGYDANGAFIPVDFKEIFGRPFYCVYYVHVENKAFVPQFGGKPFCASSRIDNNKVTKLTAAQQAKG
jgi:branched-chain amino acid transport system substrate-binding protein